MRLWWWDRFHYTKNRKNVLPWICSWIREGNEVHTPEERCASPHASRQLGSQKASSIPQTKLFCLWESLLQLIHPWERANSTHWVRSAYVSPSPLWTHFCYSHSPLDKPWLDFPAWSLLCDRKGRHVGMPVWATVVLFMTMAIASARFPTRRWIARSQVPSRWAMAPWRAGVYIQEDRLLWLPWKQSSFMLNSCESWQPMVLTKRRIALRGGTYIPWNPTVTLKRQDGIWQTFGIVFVLSGYFLPRDKEKSSPHLKALCFTAIAATVS